MEKTASSIHTPAFSVLIVAGGSGTRLGHDLPKQYLSLNGKTILRHTLDAFNGITGLKEIKVVINPAHRALYDNAVNGLSLPAPVAGGNDRITSVYNGLKSFTNLSNEEIILIHDAARPFVNSQDILHLVKEAEKYGAATLAAKVTDTLYDTKSGTYPERAYIHRIQTPQGFHYGEIVKAHEAAQKNKDKAPLTGFKDDTSLVAAYCGTPPYTVEGHEQNIKITTTQDLELAKKMIQEKQTLPVIRTGQGFDVHAFDDSGTNKPLRLGGIDIAHDRPLKGHSDADVALHALTDALLGTIGAGDIGQHFPPSDMQWKDKDSAFFLQKVLDDVKAKGGSINNIDLTIICEEPKIGPHRARMKERICTLCGLDGLQVNIKATTTEKLGFTGRSEGIASQCIATVSFANTENAA